MELRVVISRNCSPLPLKIVKWVLFLVVTRRLYGRNRFEYGSWVYRSRGWLRTSLTSTRQELDEAVGGWRDVEAARQKEV